MLVGIIYILFVILLYWHIHLLRVKTWPTMLLSQRRTVRTVPFLLCGRGRFDPNVLEVTLIIPLITANHYLITLQGIANQTEPNHFPLLRNWVLRRNRSRIHHRYINRQGHIFNLILPFRWEEQLKRIKCFKEWTCNCITPMPDSSLPNNTIPPQLITSGTIPRTQKGLVLRGLLTRTTLQP